MSLYGQIHMVLEANSVVTFGIHINMRIEQNTLKILKPKQKKMRMPGNFVLLK